MTPQFMGQGASSGIRDAANLGWKLDLVLRGLSGDALLDSYQQERQDHAKAMIDVSVRLKNLVSMTHPLKTTVRDFALRLARSTPKLSEWVKEGGFKPNPIYAKGTYFGLPRVRRNGPEGALAPQPEVRLFDGSRILLDLVLGPDFALVGYATDPRAHLSPSSLASLKRWNARFVTLFRYGGRPQGLRPERATTSATKEIAEVEDFSGEMIAWFEAAGFGPGAVAILRPDKFTFAVVEAKALEGAVAQLANKLR
jgi:3-(3-hydroxy-phenyl)propionate hydroxylase